MRKTLKKQNRRRLNKAKAPKNSRKAGKNHFFVIAVSGTPGTGKSILSHFLSRTLTFHYADVKQIIKKHKLSEGFDLKRDCLIVDTEKLSKVLISLIEGLKCSKKPKKGIVIDSHLSHFIPSEKADLCIVCTCALPILRKRLEKRGYSEAKVRENLESEIFEVCRSEALEKGHKILTLNSSLSKKEFLNASLKAVKKELNL
ncbi:MAG: adenylate kinase family protein [Candidatus Woesearchaeota archaeon]|nr:adenylate kinase family protein [Candidatus Woesearchaeota archaeon]